jgi:hypothetical protein
MESWASRSRWWIVTGYVLAFAGSVVMLANEFPVLLHDHPSGNVIFNLFLGPLVEIGSLWTWWWLSQIAVTSDDQRRLARYGVAGLAFTLVCQTAGYFTSFAELVSVISASRWTLVSWIVSGAGDLAAAIGFVGAFVGLRTPAANTAEDWDV